MKKRFCCFLFLLIFCLQHISFAQKNNKDSSIVHKDVRIDQLIKKQVQINTQSTSDGRKNSKGFRLLIINTAKREEAITAKAKVYAIFPELKTYLNYQSPYFKLKAGNFKEYEDALEYQIRLKSIFPEGVFIINDLIELKLDSEN